MPYEVILFDAYETLFDFTKSEAVALEDAFKKLGVNYDSEIADTYKRINNQLWKEMHRGAHKNRYPF